MLKVLTIILQGLLILVTLVLAHQVMQLNQQVSQIESNQQLLQQQLSQRSAGNPTAASAHHTIEPSMSEQSLRKIIREELSHSPAQTTIVKQPNSERTPSHIAATQKLDQLLTQSHLPSHEREAFYAALQHLPATQRKLYLQRLAQLSNQQKITLE
ncbi:MAG: hypothetical protein HWE11_12255 [Gammaproteobacteria bacterium]|nr:hypothetical protein [Gammaproteobacteria bacterium]